VPVTLVFLGKLADRAGAEREVPAPLDWDGLLSALDPVLAETIGRTSVKLALNGSLLADKQALVAGDGDEVAFLPPVSGG